MIRRGPNRDCGFPTSMRGADPQSRRERTAVTALRPGGTVGIRGQLVGRPGASGA